MIKAFKMKLYPGQQEEYKRRHDQLWPEMVEMIHATAEKTIPFFWMKAR